MSTSNSAALDHVQQIENWRQSNKAVITALGKAMFDLGGALVANDWNAIHPDCASLAAATTPMRDALPTPDERLNAAFTGVLDNLRAAASECSSLNAGSDDVDANSFVRHMTLAEDEMKPIYDILK